MKISKLTLKNFRNLNISFEPSPTHNLIVGENGVGKSNILDAIFHLSLAKTFKPYSVSNNINFDNDSEFAVIDSIVDIKGSTKELKIIFCNNNDSERKRLEINTKPTTKAKFIQNLDVILFAPHNINLIIGSPDIRRDELDDFISLCDYKYAIKINEYKTVIRNRNRLLKSINQGNNNLSQLDYWDHKMVDLGSFITVKRLEVLEDIKPFLDHFAKTYYQNEFEEIYIQYLYKFEGNDLESIKKQYTKKIYDNREKEIIVKQSLYGPHKDDFAFILKDKDLKTFGSRGQQRITTILLKLSMWKYLYNLKETKPIILLDDVMSELDGKNREILENIIISLDTQTFMTTTHKDDYSKKFQKSFNIIEIA